MKTRIVTGVIAAAVAVAALVFFPAWAIRIVVSVIGVIAAFELLSVGGIHHKGIAAVMYLFAAACPWLDIVSGGGLVWIALTVYVTALALVQVFCYKSVSFEQTAYVIGTSAAVLLPLSSLSYLRAVETYGLAYLVLALIVAWCSDTGAYFVGSFLGKHKLCEQISPKKTVEGFLGGIVCAVGIAVLAAVLYEQAAGCDVVLWKVALVSLITAPVSVVGDLFCSVIKRSHNIKDFGKIFPGHGGVLDRFDSLIFVAPMIYALCRLMPMVQG